MNTSNVIENDSIVLISSKDLKYANLIFVEHKKLLKENSSLNLQVNNYKEKICVQEEIDSIRMSQIIEYQHINDAYVESIETLNKTIDRKNKTITSWKIGCFAVSLGLILFLVLK